MGFRFPVASIGAMNFIFNRLVEYRPLSFGRQPFVPSGGAFAGVFSSSGDWDAGGVRAMIPPGGEAPKPP